MKNSSNRKERESATPPASSATPPPQESATPPAQEASDELWTIPENYKERADSWLNREEIKQEIRELDALKFKHPAYTDYVYHRINELLEMLDRDE